MKDAKTFAAEMIKDWRQGQPAQYLNDCLEVGLTKFANERLEKAAEIADDHLEGESKSISEKILELKS